VGQLLSHGWKEQPLCREPSGNLRHWLKRRSGGFGIDQDRSAVESGRAVQAMMGSFYIPHMNLDIQQKKQCLSIEEINERANETDLDRMPVSYQLLRALEPSTIRQAGLEAFMMLQEYAREHVLTCLIPAFFIAGAIAVFVSQASILKYFGPQAKKVLSYSVASVSGTILAVCSCTCCRFLPVSTPGRRHRSGYGFSVFRPSH